MLEGYQGIAEAKWHYSKLPESLADDECSLGTCLWGQFHLPVDTAKVEGMEPGGISNAVVNTGQRVTALRCRTSTQGRQERFFFLTMTRGEAQVLDDGSMTSSAAISQIFSPAAVQLVNGMLSGGVKLGGIPSVNVLYQPGTTVLISSSKYVGKLI